LSLLPITFNSLRKITLPPISTLPPIYIPPFGIVKAPRRPFVAGSIKLFTTRLPLI